MMILWKVFPTHVGVFPKSHLLTTSNASLPHARGGVSFPNCRSADSRSSSPRTWGCFSHGRTLHFYSTVFPTHVGVFLGKAGTMEDTSCLPHARGGVSGVP